MTKLTKDQKRKKKLLKAKKNVLTAENANNKTHNDKAKVNDMYNGVTRKVGSGIILDGECWHGYDNTSVHDLGFMNENYLCGVTKITQGNHQDFEEMLKTYCRVGQWVILPNGKEGLGFSGPYELLETAKEFMFEHFPISVIRNDRGGRIDGEVDYDSLISTLLLSSGDAAHQMEDKLDLYGYAYDPLCFIYYLLDNLAKSVECPAVLSNMILDYENDVTSLKEYVVLLETNHFNVHLKLLLIAAEQEGIGVIDVNNAE
ncbi:MAG: hypothetical protein HRT55_14080 [Colwellia sp.]|uniref:hypothetical protein n=1 Tax=Alteromonadales TaxID=135622 RepID=UPI001E153D1E|nr:MULTISPECIES: hypothetical protein [Alteromonadales]NQZ27433.1 hypothetical protein [Colwellia sp.]NRA80338.1 hypothetical protein [Pseudoalteromonas sp.]